jgi:hypothetical protein
MIDLTQLKRELQLQEAQSGVDEIADVVMQWAMMAMEDKDETAVTTAVQQQLPV